MMMLVLLTYFCFMRSIVLLLFCFFSIQAHAQNIAKWKVADVEKYLTSSDGVVVVNMWATFCKPCVAEIPGFIKITNQYKKDKVQLLLVSLDLPSLYPKKIASFAKKHKFDSRIVWLDETDADYFCPKIDKAWSGSIPATLFLNTKS